MAALPLRIGACYSNGDFGRHWSVRQVVAIGPCDEGDRALECVQYKVIAGPERRVRATCPREEFDGWARYEVVRNENSWMRV